MFETLPQLIAGVAGFLISVIAEYVPAYQNLDTKYKRLVMAVAIILAAAGSYGAACLGWLAAMLPNLALTCDEAGLVVLIQAALSALVTNQGTYTLFFKKTKK